jgi:hypothetical protein
MTVPGCVSAWLIGEPMHIADLCTSELAYYVVAQYVSMAVQPLHCCVRLPGSAVEVTAVTSVWRSQFVTAGLFLACILL